MKTLVKNLSVLIIEDNPGDQVLLETQLEKTSLSIENICMASTIAEGIRLLKETNFSLLFLDIFLPDSDGLNSYTEIARINSAIPVIILSGLSDTALALKAISLGAQDFLMKGDYTHHSLEKAVWYSIERKKNLVLLKERNERYDIISKATNDIIWDWDLLTDKVKWTGQGIEKYLKPGCAIENITDDFWASGLHPDEKSKVIKSIYHAINSKVSSWESDYRFLKNDGSYAYTNSRGYVMKNEQQVPVRMIGSMQDITDRKQAEIETQQARLAAEEARKTQEQFLANMSHEIRTPMNGVIGMAQLLSTTTLSSDQKEYVNTIKESADHLMVIINDILDLTRIVAGKIHISKTPYQWAELAHTIICMHQPSAQKKQLELKCNIQCNVPLLLVGDPVRLSQVLNNLVGNAVKFTERGEVTMLIQLEEEQDASAILSFSITDTGIGIATEKIESVFERFIQVAGDSKRKYGGTGLGLTITRQLVELQGGTIRAKSEQGKGSVFTFTLPVLKGTGNNQPVKKTAFPIPVNVLHNIEVLLVEDNLINQKVALKLLTNQGAKVDIANHGKEALDWLVRKKYDVLLMDIQMPEMDGYETTTIIRQKMNAPVCDVPIIAMTASALIADREKCLLAGMNDFIAKPFMAKELVEKISGQLLTVANTCELQWPE